MSQRCLMLVAICIMVFSTEAFSGEDVWKAVGETVSFRPTNINPPFTSIIWKQRSSSDVVKVIEWDIDDGISTPYPRFKDITTLDEKTGQITITNLALMHSGLYTIDINSKEQEQKYTLEVLALVPKPVIKIEKSSNSEVVYLICEYNEAIIWKNSAGETLKGSKNHLPGEFITVEKQGNPENFYTCTLKNAVSEKTSDPVYERDLFEDQIKAVGDTVSFRPTSINPPFTSIIWKHRSGSDVIKAIEWDIDDGYSTPNPRFKDITTLDEKTGHITITNLALIHSGVYTIDINSKEQEERFNLKVMDQIKAVGETVSFGPTNINPPFTSIIWKHRSGSDVVKAIEWDKDDGFSTPNPRFKDITTLDEKTGQITITNLTLLHSGVYTIDINSKEQEQRFTLKVEKPVPKPEIEIERSSNPDVVFLRCRYNETIIWKNAAGETLKGFKDHLKGEFITVEKQRNPENFYTCTLKNDVSEKTSDPVYERDLFKGSNGGLIAGIIILVIILIVAILICVYLLLEPVYNRVNKICPCLQALLDRIGCCTKRRKEYNLASTDNEMGSGSSSQGQKSGEETPALAE
ncbi:hypothetical protein Q8A67_004330 [Cirrhinus molitorella]|uniref:Immunoglobulin domain-containing protein n=1 Tax=Cirrhinus molitorella TaxID=172907 RepID=A0AA88TWC3_9TELE|nr:hypothetical protein Q8A67_004330 [Cirrhinus molitorella]